MSHHTPGPWVYDKNQETFTGADGSSVMTLGDCWPQGGDPNDWDAKLIVAAPDLLDALERITTVYAEEMYSERSCEEKDLREVMAARAAIAKARGDQ